jgi:hypothetical protein
LYAIDFDQFGMVVFSPVPIPDDLRPDIEGALGGKILDDVEFKRPEHLHEWPVGTPRPEAVLCVSESDPDGDPRHFQVFKFDDQVEPGYRRTGKGYGIMGSAADLPMFVESLRKLRAMARGDAPNGKSEQWSQFQQDLASETR